MCCTTKIECVNQPQQVSERKIKTKFSMRDLFALHIRTGDSVDNGDGPPQMHSIFSIEFYQKFFNVDTNIVSERITSAVIPRRAPVNYLKQNIGSNPDLYGPFWIVVTLVIIILCLSSLFLFHLHFRRYSYISDLFDCHQWQYCQLFARDFERLPLAL